MSSGEREWMAVACRREAGESGGLRWHTVWSDIAASPCATPCSPCCSADGGADGGDWLTAAPAVAAAATCCC